MPNLNKVMLIGNLTRDPELRHTPKGSSVAEISLAINRTWKDEGGNKQEETTFVEVTLWGRQAELAQQYLAKGRPVYIEGRLQLDIWDDKETGKKRSKMRVIGENMQFLSSGTGAGENPRQSPTHQNGAKPPSQTATADALDEDEDLPF